MKTKDAKVLRCTHNNNLIDENIGLNISFINNVFKREIVIMEYDLNVNFDM